MSMDMLSPEFAMVSCERGCSSLCWWRIPTKEYDAAAKTCQDYPGSMGDRPAWGSRGDAAPLGSIFRTLKNTRRVTA
jgi:hypothetical protein